MNIIKDTFITDIVKQRHGTPSVTKTSVIYINKLCFHIRLHNINHLCYNIINLYINNVRALITTKHACKEKNFFLMALCPPISIYPKENLKMYFV